MARSFRQNESGWLKCHSSVNCLKTKYLKRTFLLLYRYQRYIFWNEHEQTPGVFDFEGKNDIYTFINMAKNNGFLVILRAGYDYRRR